jgi:prepilin-type N-terminal cleavage/methylation domain-containing protein
MSCRKRRIVRGFTLVELLVVISIIALLMSMLFPATQQVIERTRQVTCASRMGNIGTALATYQTRTGGRLPPGVPSCVDPKNQYKSAGTQGGNFCQGPNWLTAILGQLGETILAEGLDNCLSSPNDCRNVTDDAEHDAWNNVGQTTPSIFICPSAPRMTLAERLGNSSQQTWSLESLSKGNYAANFGKGTLDDAIEYYGNSTGPAREQAKLRKKYNRGPFHIATIEDFTGRQGGAPVSGLTDESNTRFLGAWKRGEKYGISDIRDGTQYTIMVSELIGYDSSFDGRGIWTGGFMGGAMYTAKNLPNAKGEFNQAFYDKIPICEENITKDSPLYCGQDHRSDGQMWASARSGHPGGVNAMRCDRSVRFYNDAMELAVWHALSTYHGNPGLEKNLAID